MGKVGRPDPVKLVMGLIACSPERLRDAMAAIKSQWGDLDYEGPVFPFDYTDYYESEMGTGLLRQFVSFARLVDPGILAETKQATNTIEEKLADGEGRRTVNLDPGVLNLWQLVLATTKTAPHRIYIASGIWAEITLFYRGGGFGPVERTYADYREHSAEFDAIREIFKKQCEESAE